MREREREKEMEKKNLIDAIMHITHLIESPGYMADLRAVPLQKQSQRWPLNKSAFGEFL